MVHLSTYKLLWDLKFGVEVEKGLEGEIMCFCQRDSKGNFN